MQSVTDELNNITTYTYEHPRKLGGTQLPAVTIADSVNPRRPTVTTHSLETPIVPGFQFGIGTQQNPRQFWPLGYVGHQVSSPRGYSTSVTVDRFGAATGVYEPIPSRYTQLTRDSMSQIIGLRTVRGNNTIFFSITTTWVT